MMQRVPDDLLPLAVQHGLGHADGEVWWVTDEDLQRLTVIAAPSLPRARAAPAPERPRRLSGRAAKVRAEGVARDDRRSRLAREVRLQREHVASVRVALESLYEAQGVYIAALDDVRSSDAQVLEAHRRVLAAHDTLARAQGGR